MDNANLKLGQSSRRTFNHVFWQTFRLINKTTISLWDSGYLESALASYVVLTAYIPMLMDTGGNAGSQASVSIIRGLSLKEIEFEDIFKIIWKEIRVAALCGITLSGASFLKLIFLDKLPITVAAVVCVTLLAVVLIAKLVGCCLPMLASKVGFDPAVMASPMITTIVDALSLLVYFNIATRALHLVL